MSTMGCGTTTGIGVTTRLASEDFDAAPEAVGDGVALVAADV